MAAYEAPAKVNHDHVTGGRVAFTSACHLAPPPRAVREVSFAPIVHFHTAGEPRHKFLHHTKAEEYSVRKMLFKSRVDADTKSTQELIIFCHAQDRVLLPLPKTYEA